MRLHSFDVAMNFIAAIAFASVALAADPPVVLNRDQDHQRLMSLLNLTPTTRPGRNYDESKANIHSNLPDPLVMNDGQKVTTAEMWWNQRRPEIVEMFDREIYGRMPKNTPKVNWEVISVTNGMNGDVPIITKQLVGHVDNSSYPAIKVDIQLSLSTPAKATGPVPVMMQFGLAGGAFGARGSATGPAGGLARGPTTAIGRGPATNPGSTIPPGPTWQQQSLAKGWGYASIIPNSVQGDSGNSLQAGIIGLCNKGEPRKVDDWGVLRAWGWGASRALDYFETDKAVNAKMVGLEGHSRYGKATLVAMADDPRFAIGYVSSSGEGGAKLHRRNYAETVDEVAAVNEYHWMAGNFLKYIARWDQMPVDSHQFIALCAPRPIFITGGTWDDRGADTVGMFMATSGASAVYELLGKKGLGTTTMPKPDESLIDGDLAFRQHEGGHSDRYDWPVFITFASRYVH